MNTSQSKSQQHCLIQIKRLTQALIVSGMVNILLLAFVLYGLFGNGMLLFRDTLRPQLWHAAQVAADGSRTVEQVLQSYQQLSSAQLIARLEDTTPVQGGFTERDLALGYLILRYHFNLDQALAEAPPTLRRHIPIRIGAHTAQLALFPDLTARQYAALVQFAKTERWPFTAEGLFHELKRQTPPNDESLAEAFYLTPEFLTLQRAFARADIEIGKDNLLDLVLKGNWPNFKSLITRLHAPSESGLNVVTELLAAKSPTKNAVAAASQTPLQPLTASPKTPNPEPLKVHIVKQGESLWKIAKNYRVDIAKLKACNHLHTDLLRPGANLCIP